MILDRNQLSDAMDPVTFDCGQQSLVDPVAGVRCGMDTEFPAADVLFDQNKRVDFRGFEKRFSNGAATRKVRGNAPSFVTPPKA